MNVAYSQNIEHKCILLAKFANRYDIQNGNDSSQTHLGEDDMNRLNEYVSGLPNVLKMAGIDIFERNLDGTYIKSDKHHELGKLECVVRIVDAETVEVLAGSWVRCLDEKLLEGVDSVQRVHSIYSFSKDIRLPVDCRIVPQLFGQVASGWKSKCGIELSDALKEIQSN